MVSWQCTIKGRETARGQPQQPMQFSYWQKLTKTERLAYFEAYKKAPENKKAAKPTVKA